jgi:hypothetical protein
VLLCVHVHVLKWDLQARVPRACRARTHALGVVPANVPRARCCGWWPSALQVSGLHRIYLKHEEGAASGGSA